MSEMLELAKSVAKIAGQNAMKYFGKERSINNKSEVDLVTHVDIELDELNDILKPGENSFVGAKDGGVFLGLRKEMIKRAEKIADSK